MILGFRIEPVIFASVTLSTRGFEIFLWRHVPSWVPPARGILPRRSLDLVNIDQVIEIAFFIARAVQKLNEDFVFLDLWCPMRNDLESFVLCVCSVTSFHRATVNLPSIQSV